jgi:SHS2 domain-containing protein
MTLPSPLSSEPKISNVILQAKGATLPELFEEIARQLLTQLINPEDVGLALREKVVVEGPNLQRLLQEWVISLLNLTRIQKMVFAKIQILQVKTPDEGPCMLLAETVGELWDSQRHEIKLNIETLLCQEVRLNKDDKGYSAEIILGT